ncbi:MAG: cytochrome c4 [Xanthomonadales bacterium]|nr:cytochrome c4 [Xanthomonadales bacterium]
MNRSLPPWPPWPALPAVAAACAGRLLRSAALALGLMLAVVARGEEAVPVHPPPALPAGDAAAAPVPDMAERLAACASCHGTQGEGVVGGAEFYPHLAGKPAGYLLAQMQAFREGRRHYPRMVYLMQYMDDVWLAQIARWYADQPALAVYQRSARSLAMTPQRRARAEQLMFQGDAGAGVPACAACHGRDLAGLEPGVPALIGLPADYLVAQFGGWVTGMRRSQEPDCMADIARRLEPADVVVIANWLAAQPAQAQLRPAPADSWGLPLPCGTLSGVSDVAGVAGSDVVPPAAVESGQPSRNRP